MSDRVREVVERRGSPCEVVDLDTFVPATAIYTLILEQKVLRCCFFSLCLLLWRLRRMRVYLLTRR